MSGCRRIDSLGPPQHLLLSIYRVQAFCLCDSVTCLTSSIKNFPSLTPLGWVPKILARFASCGDTLYSIAPLGETALVTAAPNLALKDWKPFIQDRRCLDRPNQRIVGGVDGVACGMDIVRIRIRSSSPGQKSFPKSKARSAKAESESVSCRQ